MMHEHTCHCQMSTALKLVGLSTPVQYRQHASMHLTCMVLATCASLTDRAISLCFHRQKLVSACLCHSICPVFSNHTDRSTDRSTIRRVRCRSRSSSTCQSTPNQHPPARCSRCMPSSGLRDACQSNGETMRPQRRVALPILHSCKWLLFAGAIIYLFTALPGLSPHSPPTAAGTGVDLQALRSIADVVQPNVTNYIPLKFLHNFTTPCWTAADGRLQCIPGFYILGAPHSGAYQLWSMLQQHPNISKLAYTGEWWTNPHLWDPVPWQWPAWEKDLQPAVQVVAANPHLLMGGVSDLPFSYYAAHNARLHGQQVVAIKDWEPRCPPLTNPNRTACMVEVWAKANRLGDQVASSVGLTQGDLTLPLLMRAVHGTRPPKLLAVLREPTSRLHAGYYAAGMYEPRYGSRGGIANYTAEMMDAIEDCMVAHGAHLCATRFEHLDYKYEKLWYHADQIWRGTHSAWVEGWLQYFGGDFMAVFLDELMHDKRATMQRVVNHLGLGPLTDQVWQEMQKAEGLEPSLEPNGDLPTAAKSRMDAFYAPFNERLGKLLFGKAVNPWSNQAWAKAQWVAGRGGQHHIQQP